MTSKISEKNEAKLLREERRKDIIKEVTETMKKKDNYERDVTDLGKKAINVIENELRKKGYVVELREKICSHSCNGDCAHGDCDCDYINRHNYDCRSLIKYCEHDNKSCIDEPDMHDEECGYFNKILLVNNPDSDEEDTP